MSDKLVCKIKLRTRKRSLFGEVSETRLEQFYNDDNDFITIKNEVSMVIFKGDIAKIIILQEFECLIIDEPGLTIINPLNGHLRVI